MGNLTNLTGLWLGNNQISDWTPVRHVPDVFGRP
ncbi:MAG: hypothetical protein FWG87_15260 [Defluviitaleaceae bacterium]|nr:hypothetical protein [Defluviitaleaceae bacterium]